MKEKCKLLATHDDYTLMSKLPRERTSVMTIVRDPIARVLSTYEFSVEVAARFLVHPNLTSATKMAVRVRKSNVISTLDLSPWKYLVPWMRKGLFARIKSLNNLDVELYKYAKEIFAREHEVVVLTFNRSFVDLPNELRSVIGEWVMRRYGSSYQWP